MSLSEMHAGATMSEGPRPVPLAFGPVGGGVGVLRIAAGVLDLGDHEAVEIRGRHTERFLHSMLSQDVKSLAPGAPGRLGTFLTDTGKTVGLLLLLRLEDRRFLALAPPGFTAGVVPALRRFVLAQDVTFAPLDESHRLLSVQGPGTPALLTTLGITLDEPYAWRHAAIGGVEALVVEHGRCGERGADLLVPAEAAPAVWAQLRAAGASPVGVQALDVARIEAGIPWLGRELDEGVIPLEAHLRHAISYKKGCYIGQETIAMTTYRGEPPRLLRGLRLSGEGPLPAPGALLTRDGKKAGVLTSAAVSPTLGPIALALVKNRMSAPGGVVTVDGAEATIEELPFVRGSALVPAPVDA